MVAVDRAVVESPRRAGAAPALERGVVTGGRASVAEATRVAAHGLDVPGPVGDRDLAVDAARVGALVLVVCAHVLLVTLVTVPGTGGVSLTMAPTRHSWFWWFSWIVQIMPLFFVVGGFSSAVSWARFADGPGASVGAKALCWIRGRLLRLAQPAAVLWVSLAVVTAGALAAGAPVGEVRLALSGLGMHLWFLGAYALCLALVPLTHAAHRRHPYLSLGALLVVCAAAEIPRLVTGDHWWGLLSLGPVWVTIHQLGYFRADGTAARARGPVMVLAAGAGYLALWALVSTGWWVRDMLAGLNPPSLTLVVLGFSQACLLQALTPALSRLMSWRPVQAAAWLIGSRPVTLYLWHLPVIVLVMSVWWLSNAPEPEPASGRWWLWRIPLALICWAGSLAVVRMFGRWETTAVLPPATRARALAVVPSTPHYAAVVLAVILLIVPVVLEIRFLLNPVLVTVGAVAYLAAAVLLRWAPDLRRPADAPEGEASLQTEQRRNM
nr:acyltransferase [Kocuria sp. JC486]